MVRVVRAADLVPCFADIQQLNDFDFSGITVGAAREAIDNFVRDSSHTTRDRADAVRVLKTRVVDEPEYVAQQSDVRIIVRYLEDEDDSSDFDF